MNGVIDVLFLLVPTILLFAGSFMRVEMGKYHPSLFTLWTTFLVMFLGGRLLWVLYTRWASGYFKEGLALAWGHASWWDVLVMGVGAVLALMILLSLLRFLRHLGGALRRGFSQEDATGRKE